MKILVVTPIFPPEAGGPATYSAELLERLPPKVSAEVVGFGKGLVPVTGPTVMRQVRLFLACLLKGTGADIFYLQEPAVVGLAGLVAAKVLGKIVLAKFVGDPEWEEMMRGGRPGGRLAWVTKFVLNRSDRVVVPAGFLVEFLTKNYGVPQGKIVVVPNSVKISKEGHRKVPGRLIFVGRLVPWKNVDFVIRAVGRLIKENIDSRLVVVGDGPEEDNLKSLVRKLRLPKTIKFLGKLTREETRREIERSEVLILFSDYEGLSHVALEAMAAGTVVVASDISGNREVVQNGKTGLLVRSGNISELARNIERVLKNKNLREELARESKREVERKYRWEVNLPLLKKVFYEVCER